MNGNCIDSGTIQAFLDGETTADVTLRLSEHIEECAACANLLAVAEDENSFVFSTLEREMNTLVPTQRLWSRINESIEVQKAQVPIWKQVYAFISTSLLSPSMTAAAGVLIVFGFVAVMWTLRSGSSDAPNGDLVAGQTNVQTSGSSPSGTDLNPPSTAPVPTEASTTDTDMGAITVSRHPPKKLEEMVREANRRNEIRPITLDYNSPLPGEQSYIQTISDLKEAYDGRRDAVFTGSSRVAFERDLAVVNNGIKRMQKAVRKNPNNQAARQVLYAAYQDKIDLLNTVAQRDELMASIQ